jgi:hypothetical protein
MHFVFARLNTSNGRIRGDHQNSWFDGLCRMPTRHLIWALRRMSNLYVAEGGGGGGVVGGVGGGGGGGAPPSPTVDVVAITNPALLIIRFVVTHSDHGLDGLDAGRSRNHAEYLVCSAWVSGCWTIFGQLWNGRILDGRRCEKDFVPGSEIPDISDRHPPIFHTFILMSTRSLP